MSYVKSSYMVAKKGNSLCFVPDIGTTDLTFQTHGSLQGYLSRPADCHGVGSVLYTPTHRMEEVVVEGEPEPFDFKVGDVYTNVYGNTVEIIAIEAVTAYDECSVIGVVHKYSNAAVRLTPCGRLSKGGAPYIKPRSKKTKVKKWVPIYTPPADSQDTEF